MKIVDYDSKYVLGAISVWNEVVDDGLAFPQEDFLDEISGDAFFTSQTLTALALDDDDNVLGLYILHPNNIGRCGHICNASYAVKSSSRGQHIGEALVIDCVHRAGGFGFSILQFNAVVADNIPALSLYKKLGFTQLGAIPHGFRSKNGEYKDIIVHYIELNK